jgi:hypothetical protein
VVDPAHIGEPPHSAVLARALMQLTRFERRDAPGLKRTFDSLQEPKSVASFRMSYLHWVVQPDSLDVDRGCRVS